MNEFWFINDYGFINELSFTIGISFLNEFSVIIEFNLIQGITSLHQIAFQLMNMLKLNRNQYSHSVAVKREDIKNSICTWISKDHLPANIVNGTGFKWMIRHFFDNFDGMDERTVRRRLDKKYECVDPKLKQTFQNIDYISLSVDIWTETHHNRSFFRNDSSLF